MYGVLRRDKATKAVARDATNSFSTFMYNFDATQFQTPVMVIIIYQIQINKCSVSFDMAGPTVKGAVTKTG